MTPRTNKQLTVVMKNQLFSGTVYQQQTNYSQKSCTSNKPTPAPVYQHRRNERLPGIIYRQEPNFCQLPYTNKKRIVARNIIPTNKKTVASYLISITNEHTPGNKKQFSGTVHQQKTDQLLATEDPYTKHERTVARNRIPTCHLTPYTNKK